MRNKNYDFPLQNIIKNIIRKLQKIVHLKCSRQSNQVIQRKIKNIRSGQKSFYNTLKSKLASYTLSSY